MHTDIHSILKKYWGYSTFRPQQEEIIGSIIQGNDTLALLPTGGGKSICFQVPAMAMEGLCLVISPLIALMKDQVNNLTKKGIKAVALTSAMHKREIDIVLDNCVFGNTKFLYISPERLSLDVTIQRIKKMKISLIAVDEAHCISQWGYDFRPSYKAIADVRELLPGVPILALTATATKEVVKDIQENLKFTKQNVFESSFERKNIAYVVRKTENKLNETLHILSKIKGSAIVYTRTRKGTQEISSYLNSVGIQTDYYHAGLEFEIRNTKQENWIQNKTRVMVSTNAFGMGIDKPDVRCVIHCETPNTLEAYFQEAGRAGRDEQKGYAVLLINGEEETELINQFEREFPTISDIRRTYQAIANFYQIAIGSGEGSTYDFDMNELCKIYPIEPLIVYQSIKFLEREGYLVIIENFLQPARCLILHEPRELYNIQVQNPKLDPLVKALMRNYAGIFEGYTTINEFELAKKSGQRKEDIITQLNFLNSSKVISYLPQTNLPQLSFTKPRADAKDLSISPEIYSIRKKQSRIKIDAVINYFNAKETCRSKILLYYFGQINAPNCGNCDVCLSKVNENYNASRIEELEIEIIELLKLSKHSIEELLSLTGHKKNNILEALRWLTDEEKISRSGDYFELKKIN